MKKLVNDIITLLEQSKAEQNIIVFIHQIKPELLRITKADSEIRTRLNNLLLEIKNGAPVQDQTEDQAGIKKEKKEIKDFIFSPSSFQKSKQSPRIVPLADEEIKQDGSKAEREDRTVNLHKRLLELIKGEMPEMNTQKELEKTYKELNKLGFYKTDKAKTAKQMWAEFLVYARKELDV